MQSSQLQNVGLQSTGNESSEETPAWARDPTVAPLAFFSPRSRKIRATKQFVSELAQWRKSEMVTLRRLKGVQRRIMMFLQTEASYLDNRILLECDLEEEIIALLALYMDFELRILTLSKKEQEQLRSEGKDPQNKLIQDAQYFPKYEQWLINRCSRWLYTLLPAHDRRLDALLSTTVYSRKTRAVLDPLFRKVLWETPKGPLNSVSYVRHMIAYKIWRERALVAEDEGSKALNDYVRLHLHPKDFKSFPRPLLRCLGRGGTPEKHARPHNINLKDACLHFKQCKDFPDTISDAINYESLEIFKTKGDEVDELMDMITERKKKRTTVCTAVIDLTSEDVIDLTMEDDSVELPLFNQCAVNPVNRTPDHRTQIPFALHHMRREPLQNFNRIVTNIHCQSASPLLRRNGLNKTCALPANPETVRSPEDEMALPDEIESSLSRISEVLKETTLSQATTDDSVQLRPMASKQIDNIYPNPAPQEIISYLPLISEVLEETTGSKDDHLQEETIRQMTPEKTDNTSTNLPQETVSSLSMSSEVLEEMTTTEDNHLQEETVSLLSTTSEMLEKMAITTDNLPDDLQKEQINNPCSNLFLQETVSSSLSVVSEVLEETTDDSKINQPITPEEETVSSLPMISEVLKGTAAPEDDYFQEETVSISPITSDIIEETRMSEDDLNYVHLEEETIQTTVPPEIDNYTNLQEIEIPLPMVSEELKEITVPEATTQEVNITLQEDGTASQNLPDKISTKIIATSEPEISTEDMNSINDHPGEELTRSINSFIDHQKIDSTRADLHLSEINLLVDNDVLIETTVSEISAEVVCTLEDVNSLQEASINKSKTMANTCLSKNRAPLSETNLPMGSGLLIEPAVSEISAEDVFIFEDAKDSQKAFINESQTMDNICIPDNKALHHSETNLPMDSEVLIEPTVSEISAEDVNSLQEVSVTKSQEINNSCASDNNDSHLSDTNLPMDSEVLQEAAVPEIFVEDVLNSEHINSLREVSINGSQTMPNTCASKNKDHHFLEPNLPIDNEMLKETPLLEISTEVEDVNSLQESSTNECEVLIETAVSEISAEDVLIFEDSKDLQKASINDPQTMVNICIPDNKALHHSETNLPMDNEVLQEATVPEMIAEEVFILEDVNSSQEASNNESQSMGDTCASENNTTQFSETNLPMDNEVLKEIALPEISPEVEDFNSLQESSINDTQTIESTCVPENKAFHLSETKLLVDSEATVPETFAEEVLIFEDDNSLQKASNNEPQTMANICEFENKAPHLSEINLPMNSEVLKEIIMSKAPIDNSKDDHLQKESIRQMTGSIEPQEMVNTSEIFRENVNCEYNDSIQDTDEENLEVEDNDSQDNWKIATTVSFEQEQDLQEIVQRLERLEKISQEVITETAVVVEEPKLVETSHEPLENSEILSNLEDQKINLVVNVKKKLEKRKEKEITKNEGNKNKRQLRDPKQIFTTMQKKSQKRLMNKLKAPQERVVTFSELKKAAPMKEEDSISVSPKIQLLRAVELVPLSAEVNFENTPRVSVPNDEEDKLVDEKMKLGIDAKIKGKRKNGLNNNFVANGSEEIISKHVERVAKRNRGRPPRIPKSNLKGSAMTEDVLAKEATPVSVTVQTGAPVKVKVVKAQTPGAKPPRRRKQDLKDTLNWDGKELFICCSKLSANELNNMKSKQISKSTDLSAEREMGNNRKKRGRPVKNKKPAELVTDDSDDEMPLSLRAQKQDSTVELVSESQKHNSREVQNCRLNLYRQAKFVAQFAVSEQMNDSSLSSSPARDALEGNSDESKSPETFNNIEQVLLPASPVEKPILQSTDPLALEASFNPKSQAKQKSIRRKFRRKKKFTVKKNFLQKISDQEKQPPMILHQQKQPPLILDQEKQLPLILDQEKQLPLILDQEKQLPLLLNQEKQPSLILDQEKQLPVILDQAKQPPLILDQEKQPSLILDQEKQPPLILDEEKQPSLILDREKQLPVILKETSDVLQIAESNFIDETMKPEDVLTMKAAGGKEANQASLKDCPNDSSTNKLQFDKTADTAMEFSPIDTCPLDISFGVKRDESVSATGEEPEKHRETCLNSIETLDTSAESLGVYNPVTSDISLDDIKTAEQELESSCLNNLNVAEISHTSLDIYSEQQIPYTQSTNISNTSHEDSNLLEPTCMPVNSSSDVAATQSKINANDVVKPGKEIPDKRNNIMQRKSTMVFKVIGETMISLRPYLDQQQDEIIESAVTEPQISVPEPQISVPEPQNEIIISIPENQDVDENNLVVLHKKSDLLIPDEDQQQDENIESALTVPQISVPEPQNEIIISIPENQDVNDDNLDVLHKKSDLLIPDEDQQQDENIESALAEPQISVPEPQNEIIISIPENQDIDDDNLDAIHKKSDLVILDEDQQQDENIESALTELQISVPEPQNEIIISIPENPDVDDDNLDVLHKKSDLLISDDISTIILGYLNTDIVEKNDSEPLSLEACDDGEGPVPLVSKQPTEHIPLTPPNSNDVNYVNDFGNFHMLVNTAAELKKPALNQAINELEELLFYPDSPPTENSSPDPAASPSVVEKKAQPKERKTAEKKKTSYLPRIALVKKNALSPKITKNPPRSCVRRTQFTPVATGTKNKKMVDNATKKGLDNVGVEKSSITIATASSLENQSGQTKIIDELDQTILSPFERKKPRTQLTQVTTGTKNKIADNKTKKCLKYEGFKKSSQKVQEGQTVSQVSFECAFDELEKPALGSSENKSEQRSSEIEFDKLLKQHKNSTTENQSEQMKKVEEPQRQSEIVINKLLEEHKNSTTENQSEPMKKVEEPQRQSEIVFDKLLEEHKNSTTGNQSEQMKKVEEPQRESEIVFDKLLEEHKNSTTGNQSEQIKKVEEPQYQSEIVFDKLLEEHNNSTTGNQSEQIKIVNEPQRQSEIVFDKLLEEHKNSTTGNQSEQIKRVKEPQRQSEIVFDKLLEEHKKSTTGEHKFEQTNKVEPPQSEIIFDKLLEEHKKSLIIATTTDKMSSEQTKKAEKYEKSLKVATTIDKKQSEQTIKAKEQPRRASEEEFDKLLKEHKQSLITATTTKNQSEQTKKVNDQPQLASEIEFDKLLEEHKKSLEKIEVAQTDNLELIDNAGQMEDRDINNSMQGIGHDWLIGQYIETVEESTDDDENNRVEEDLSAYERDSGSGESCCVVELDVPSEETQEVMRVSIDISTIDWSKVDWSRVDLSKIDWSKIDPQMKSLIKQEDSRKRKIPSDDEDSSSKIQKIDQDNQPSSNSQVEQEEFLFLGDSPSDTEFLYTEIYTEVGDVLYYDTLELFKQHNSEKTEQLFDQDHRQKAEVQVIKTVEEDSVPGDNEEPHNIQNDYRFADREVEYSEFSTDEMTLVDMNHLQPQKNGYKTKDTKSLANETDEIDRISELCPAVQPREMLNQEELFPPMKPREENFVGDELIQTQKKGKDKLQEELFSAMQPREEVSLVDEMIQTQNKSKQITDKNRTLIKDPNKLQEALFPVIQSRKEQSVVDELIPQGSVNAFQKQKKSKKVSWERSIADKNRTLMEEPNKLQELFPPMQTWKVEKNQDCIAGEMFPRGANTTQTQKKSKRVQWGRSVADKNRVSMEDPNKLQDLFPPMQAREIEKNQNYGIDELFPRSANTIQAQKNSKKVSWGRFVGNDNQKEDQRDRELAAGNLFPVHSQPVGTASHKRQRNSNFETHASIPKRPKITPEHNKYAYEDKMDKKIIPISKIVFVEEKKHVYPQILDKDHLDELLINYSSASYSDSDAVSSSSNEDCRGQDNTVDHLDKNERLRDLIYRQNHRTQFF